MMKFLIAAILCFVNIAHASTYFDENKLDFYLSWIDANTSYKVKNFDKTQLPPFVEMKNADFVKEFGDDTKGAFNIVQQKIFYPETVEKEQRFDGVMIHELIHFFQVKSKKSFLCMASMEREAYDAQVKYLEQRKLSVDISKVQILVLSMCAPEYTKRSF